MATDEEFKAAKQLVEETKTAREQEFKDEFEALKKKYPDIQIGFIIHNEQELITRIFNEIKAANKVMSITAK